MAFSSRTFLRNPLLSLIATASVSATSIALAQDRTAAHHTSVAVAQGNEQQFMIDNELALSRMSRGMMVDPTGDIDRDFVAMMVPHHQGAIDMAVAELKYGHNAELRRLAQNIIAQQGREIAQMRQAVGESAVVPQDDGAAPRVSETDAAHAQ